MINHILKSGTFRAIIFVTFFIYFLAGIGTLIQDDPRPSVKWPTPKSQDIQSYNKKSKSQFQIALPKYSKKEPWDNDRKEHTENWIDFIEELENRGYTIQDPEAQDIWEKHY